MSIDTLVQAFRSAAAQVSELQRKQAAAQNALTMAQANVATAAQELSTARAALAAARANLRSEINKPETP